jgi:ribosomal protein L37AE/L43A
MGFEDIPEDREESYPCKCGGNITQDKENGEIWQCDNCDWVPLKMDRDGE